MREFNFYQANALRQANKLKQLRYQNYKRNDVFTISDPKFIESNPFETTFSKLVTKSTRVKDISSNEKFIERLIKISRVTKVTKGGKKLSFRAVVVIGNENGKVGVGVGKAEDVVNAFKKAKTNGRKNLIQIPLTKSLTIPHPIIGDVGACKIILKPGVEGSGVMAGGAVRTVLEVAGIKNIIAKQLGSDNLLNNARATVIALESLITRLEVSQRRNFSGPVNRIEKE
jgi:small subunit ribosomal protein S5